MRKDQRIEALIDLIRDDGPTIHDGIQAIREMQAELAIPEDGSDLRIENERLREEIQTTKASMGFEECNRLRAGRGELLAQRDNALNDVERLKEELHIARNSCNFGQGKRIMAGCDKALTEADHLKEELRIAGNSWNFEEGKRIMGERDKAQAELKRARRERDDAIQSEDGWVSKLNAADEQLARYRDKLRVAEEAGNKAEGEAERLRGRLDRIEALTGELRSERAAAMIERDDLRTKLRATEEAADVAEGRRYAFGGRTVREWREEVIRLRGLMSEAKKLIDQGSCDD